MMRDDAVRARLVKARRVAVITMAAADKSPDGHAGRETCPDPVDAVFKDEAAQRRAFELLRRIKKDVGMRLAVGDKVRRIDMRRGEIEEPHAFEFSPEELRARGGGDGHRAASRAGGAKRAVGAGDDREPRHLAPPPRQHKLFEFIGRGAAVNGDYGELLQIAHWQAQAGQTPSEFLARKLEEFARAAGLTQGLGAAGVQKSDVPKLAEDASNQWTGKFNPRPLDAAAAREIYECAW